MAARPPNVHFETVDVDFGTKIAEHAALHAGVDCSRVSVGLKSSSAPSLAHEHALILDLRIGSSNGRRKVVNWSCGRAVPSAPHSRTDVYKDVLSLAVAQPPHFLSSTVVPAHR